MKFPRTYTLKEISNIIDTEFVGDEEHPITGINEIHVVEKGDVVFVDHPKYYDKALESAATVVLINKKVDCPEGKALLLSDDPFRDFNKLSKFFKPFQTASKSIATSAEIGKDTIIQPNVFIGNNVVIGERCLIHPNVTIYDNCVIGNNVEIHAGTVLGADGFYFKNRPEGYDKLISCGRVVIEDNVEIGANCTIDKGVTGDTRIGAGSKLDNMIQIAHDTVIGKKCLMASLTAVAGCTIIEDEVVIWGQCGIVSGITIGKKAVLMAKSGVSRSIEGGKVYWGAPVSEFRDRQRQLVAIKKLPELLKKMM